MREKIQEIVDKFFTDEDRGVVSVIEDDEGFQIDIQFEVKQLPVLEVSEAMLAIVEYLQSIGYHNSKALGPNFFANSKMSFHTGEKS